MIPENLKREIAEIIAISCACTFRSATELVERYVYEIEDWAAKGFDADRIAYLIAID